MVMNIVMWEIIRVKKKRENVRFMTECELDLQHPFISNKKKETREKSSGKGILFHRTSPCRMDKSLCFW